MRRRFSHARGLVTAIAFAAGASEAHAQAEPSSPPPRQTARSPGIGGDAQGPCVQVDVAGERAGQLDCVNRAIEDAAAAARRASAALRAIPVPQAGSPDVQVGVASRAGTRQRLGQNFGVSVHPPRPVPVQTNPMGRRP